MKQAFGTYTLLLYGRDEGISEHITWKVSFYDMNILVAIRGTAGPARKTSYEFHARAATMNADTYNNGNS